MANLLFALVLLASEGPWQPDREARPPVLNARVEPVPAHHGALNHLTKPSFIVACAHGGVRARLRAATRRGLEPVRFDAAMSTTRVRFALDDGEWESAVWARDYDTVTASAEFLERLEGARQAVIEVRVMCPGCEAAPRIAYTIDATGVSALAHVCRGRTDDVR